MHHFLLCLLMTLALPSLIVGQEVPSPESYLGYPLGSRFSYHHQVVGYVSAVAEASPKVTLMPYGKTVEGRPLLTVAITSEANMARLETIRLNNLKASGLLEGRKEGTRLPIIWLSYNVHGDEAVCTEAAMACLYELAQGAGATAQWLDKMVIILDPCLNPDGRDRYVNWYHQKVAMPPNAHIDSWEHHQPWPGGRFNHYLYDLNRDWCWQTQQESQARVAHYQQWMPQIHVDFHEMGHNSPYFFAPAAEPYHSEITGWQREFQRIMGANHAHYFDQNHWMYYTGEVFDLFYPSYGDTWPIFNGAHGFTYEQGGSGRAGLKVQRERGDTLSLQDRMAHHFTTSLSTIEVAFKNRDRLLEEYDQYFCPKPSSDEGHRSYVIKHTNPLATLQHFTQLLDRQQINYQFISDKKPKRTFMGYSYQKRIDNTYFTLEKGDIVIHTSQPKARLVRVLFEAESKLSDSLTYDLTAWSLPFAYNLQAYVYYGLLGNGKTAKNGELKAFSPASPSPQVPYGFVCAWEDVQDARFLGALLKSELRVRFTHAPFTIGGRTFGRGALIIPKAENADGYEMRVLRLANQHEQLILPIYTGKSDDGTDLGSRSKKIVAMPKVALISGKGVSATSFGDLWHYFEQTLQYPVTILDTDYLSSVNLHAYDLLILPSGNYEAFREKLLSFAKLGGRIIALERAIREFTHIAEGGNPTQLATVLSQRNEAHALDNMLEAETEAAQFARYEDQERSALSYSVAGSIYAVELDPSHPLAFGYGGQFFLIKRNNQPYPFLSENAWNIGKFTPNSHVSGFVGAKLKQQVANTLAIGMEEYGSGKIIYMTDSPVFRGFWHGGKLLMANAVFF